MSDVLPDTLWTLSDVAAYLRIPTNSIYKMTARKARQPIPHLRISGRLRFRRADIDEWLSLLSVSNVDLLRTMRRKAKEVSHGHDSPPQDAEW